MSGISYLLDLVDLLRGGGQINPELTLLVTKGIATRSKDATSGSWPYYQ